MAVVVVFGEAGPVKVGLVMSWRSRLGRVRYGVVGHCMS